MNNLIFSKDIFQAQLAGTPKSGKLRFFFGVERVACIQPIWVGWTQVGGGQSGFNR